MHCCSTLQSTIAINRKFGAKQKLEFECCNSALQSVRLKFINLSLIYVLSKLELAEKKVIFFMQMLAVRHKVEVMKWIQWISLTMNCNWQLATIAVGGALLLSFIIIIRREICAQMNSFRNVKYVFVFCKLQLLFGTDRSQRHLWSPMTMKNYSPPHKVSWNVQNVRCHARNGSSQYVQVITQNAQVKFIQISR